MNTELRVTSAPTLGHSEEVAYRALLNRCNAAEGIDLPFYFDEEAAVSNSPTVFFEWSDSNLIGFGHLPNDPAPEGCLMVDPDYRRQGHGSKLLAGMRRELAERTSVEATLLADQKSESGKAFLSDVALEYRSSEFRLELDRAAIGQCRPRIPGYTMRVAERSDADVLIDILMAAFDESREDAQELVERGLNERSRSFYLATVNGEAAGVVRAGEIDGAGDITAFGVRPVFQGRGIGRQILNETIDTLTASGLERIVLEVEIENANALGLYTSCGFRVASEYGFYSLTAS